MIKNRDGRLYPKILTCPLGKLFEKSSEMGKIVSRAGLL
jgi:hypothetical protein